MARALFINHRTLGPLPFQVPDDFDLESDDGEGFMQNGGGFLKFPDGRQLWVEPGQVLTAYLMPLADGQRIALS